LADRLPCAGLACNDRRVHLLLLAQSADATGLARGRSPAPSWVIALVGVVVVALAVAFLVLRVRRAKKPPTGARGPGERQ
jgi:hypothetical protein